MGSNQRLPDERQTKSKSLFIEQLKIIFFYLLTIKDTFHYCKTHRQRKMTEVTRFSLLDVVKLSVYINITKV